MGVVLVEHDRVTQQGFEVGQGPRQRSGRRREPVEGESPRTAEFQLGGGFVEQIERGGVGGDGFHARPQHGLQPLGQVFLRLAVGRDRHAGRQLGLPPPEHCGSRSTLRASRRWSRPASGRSLRSAAAGAGGEGFRDRDSGSGLGTEVRGLVCREVDGR